MSFVIYNSLTKKKIVFKPLNPPQIKMYCCGPTVYDFLHIGNFRGAVFFNFLRHWLEHKGYQVTYTYNFTDVDNKILDRAKKENKTMKEIADTYISEFKKDFKTLKLTKHEHNPQATQFIPDMIKLIQTLVKKQKAYVIDKDVFYNVKSFTNYGQLSSRKIFQNLNISRVKIDKRKSDPRDFALWKSCPKNEPGWNSPWGYGRPGWHIECTSMIFSLLGNTIDIHGGGTDLIFPHHENELAQAEGATQTPFVKYWVHNNMFTFSGEKMSKSIGNVSLMRDFLKKYNGEVFKYLVLSSHYRSVIEVSDHKILQCVQALSRIYTFLKIAQTLILDSDTLKKINSSLEQYFSNQTFVSEILLIQKKIESSLDDDLNTPIFFSLIFTLIREFNEKSNSKTTSKKELAIYAYLIQKLIKKYGKTMSLFQEVPSSFLESINNIYTAPRSVNIQKIQELIKKRSQARNNKDFKLADQIRNQLIDMDIELNDSDEGTTWEIKKNLKLT